MTKDPWKTWVLVILPEIEVSWMIQSQLTGIYLKLVF